jgi:hypothetical protein
LRFGVADTRGWSARVIAATSSGQSPKAGINLASPRARLSGAAGIQQLVPVGGSSGHRNRTGGGPRCHAVQRQGDDLSPAPAMQRAGCSHGGGAHGYVHADDDGRRDCAWLGLLGVPPAPTATRARA